MKLAVFSLFFSSTAFYSSCNSTNSETKGGKSESSLSSNDFYLADLSEAEAFLKSIKTYDNKEQSCAVNNNNPYSPAEKNHGKSPTSTAKKDSSEPSHTYLFPSSADGNFVKQTVIEVNGELHVFSGSQTKESLASRPAIGDFDLVSSFKLDDQKNSVGPEVFGKVVGDSYFLKSDAVIDHVYTSKLGEASIKIKKKLFAVHLMVETSKGKDSTYKLLTSTAFGPNTSAQDGKYIGMTAKLEKIASVNEKGVVTFEKSAKKKFAPEKGERHLTYQELPFGTYKKAHCWDIYQDILD